VVGEQSVGTVSCRFPSFEAELGFWNYVFFQVEKALCLSYFSLHC